MSILLRKNTEAEQDETVPVDHKRQQVVFALAVKGEGKSYLIESLAEEEFRLGYSGIDLHSPLSGNMENAFWCIPKLKDVDEERAFRKNPIPFIQRRRCFKISLLASESIMYPQEKMDKFNGRPYTRAEWYNEHKNDGKHYDMIYPQMKPQNKWGKEMIRVVKLPPVTSKGESENDLKARQIIWDELKKCRTERRIMVLNRKMFGNEKQYFWTMENVIRGLQDYYDLNCPRLIPSDVGKTRFSEMTPVERNWHKMFVITRELAELAPAKFKADKSGESTSVKRSLVQLARTCRHGEIDWFGDWQRNNDVDDQVRAQCDTWMYKKYNLGLAGEEKKYFFERVQEERQKIIDKHRGRKIGFLIAKSLFPRIRKLSKKFFYCHFQSDNVKLFPVPKVFHMHKAVGMKFHELTGIWFEHDLTKVPQNSSGGANKVKVNEKRAVYEVMASLKLKNKGWDDIRKKLAVLQEKGEVKWSSEFSSKENNALSAIYSRLRNKFESIEK